MVKRSNIIEVNGKRYDAATGRLLDAAKSHVISPQPHAGMVDGVMKPRRVSGEARQHHPAPRSAQKSKTLMRQAVKKPGPGRKAVVHHENHQEHTTAFVHPTERIKRASTVPKSSFISRFGNPAASAVRAKVDIVPVREAPPQVEPEPSILSTTLQHAVSPFQQALEHATSHTQPKHKKTKAHHKLAHKIGVKPKVISIGASSLAVLLIAGFVAYQNVPNVAMRVAAAKAGIHGSLPGYQPAGFSMAGPIRFTAGQITISYRSNSDDRQFDVVQRASEWTSDALLKEHVAVGQRSYQTFQEQDRTIYIYDGSNATWVDRGIWYEIKGSAALNSDQLLRMAQSL